MPRYDIHVQGLPETPSHGYKCMGFVYEAPLKVTGFQALINRWAKTLLTPLGSDLLDPEYGTQFGNLIGANFDRNNYRLIQDTVNMAVSDANKQVHRQDADGFFDASEQLDSAEVIGYEDVDAGFSVWVRIKNKAGDSAETAVATIGASRY
jgi:hypothetical protein